MTQYRRNYRRRQDGGSASPRPADIYQQVTDRIIAGLEAGTVPWRKPWRTAGGMPRSMSTGRRYQGVNVMLLAMTAADRGYTSSWWGTRRQVNEQGGWIRKGQNRENGKGATYVSVWRDYVPQDADADDGAEDDPDAPGARKRVVARMVPVFNADQCQDLPERFYPKPGAPVGALAGPEAVLAAYEATPGAAPVFYDVHGEAHYDLVADQIHMPKRDEHTSAGRYYSTQFHERVHSTGHASRLARETVGHGHKFGSPGYGREELVAELGAAFLCAETGTETGDTAEQSAAYLADWLATIREDRKLVVQSASAAQKAADLIVEPSRQAQRAEDRGGELDDPDPDGEPDPGIEAA
jgi:antirestriction protein ArdC